MLLQQPPGRADAVDLFCVDHVALCFVLLVKQWCSMQNNTPLEIPLPDPGAREFYLIEEKELCRYD